MKKNYHYSQFFSLIWALSSRDIISRYRKSILGPAWAFAQPCAYISLFSFLRGVSHFSNEGIPYPLFTFTALLPWSFMANAVTQCSSIIIANATIIKKIAAPKEIFPIASVVVGFFDFLIYLSILFLMMLCYGKMPSSSLFWLPFLIFLTILLTLGVGMLMASIGTFRRDIVIAAPFIIQFWLFLSPVMYPLAQVPERWRSIYIINPMVGIIESFRSVMLKDSSPPFELFSLSCVTCIGVFIFAWPLFRWTSQYFADAI